MADVEPFPFASVEDLLDRWPDFPVGAEAHAEVLLVDASDYILDVCPAAADARSETRRRVVCAVVRRVMESESAPSGVDSLQETTGPFSTSYKFTDTSFYLRKDERKALGDLPKAFGVQVASRRGGECHRPWCNLNLGATYCSCGAGLTGGEPLWEA